MDPDDQLEKKIKIYQGLGKENPNVDVGMLMLNALQNQKQNMVSAKAKRWVYLVSIGVPPFGLLCAIYYFFGAQDDAKQVAWTCVILTAVSVVLFWASVKLLFSGSGASVQQIEKITPAQIQQLGQ
jgi:hypothetical protein